MIVHKLTEKGNLCCLLGTTPKTCKNRKNTFLNQFSYLIFEKEFFGKMKKSSLEYEKGRLRQNQIILRLDDLELEMLNDKCEASDCQSRSEFLRDLIVFGNVIKVDKSVYSAFDESTYQLEKIGNNINQIAKKINQQKQVYKSDLDEVKMLMQQVWQIQRAVLKSLP